MPVSTRHASDEAKSGEAESDDAEFLRRDAFGMAVRRWRPIFRGTLCTFFELRYLERMRAENTAMEHFEVRISRVSSENSTRERFLLTMLFPL